jgi:hypothetical protein
MMIPRVVEVRYVEAFTVHVRFADGTEGDVDLSEELHGEIFEPLKDPSYFKRFTVNHELHTITWPNGADFAPEFLYRKVRVAA